MDSSVPHHSSIGTATLMAGAVIHISTGDYSQATSANMLIKCKNSTKEVEQNQKTQIGQNDEKTVRGTLTEKITGIRRSVAGAHELIGSSVRLGSDSINVLTLLTDILDVVDELAKATATHTHSNTGAPTNSGNLSAIAGKTRTLNKKYAGFID
ncbi:phage tail sheath family protein [Photorhabdus sp. CRCIA-P01]|uniref:phage tail sheath family protein n=1 Tax=Photorhabdus sp. CRCIA-P01 TaxID=2019570 RepID=UPI000E5A0625|nr:phage tail sheath family protein [Photorhabdus sp. CRCIA-P01]